MRNIVHSRRMLPTQLQDSRVKDADMHILPAIEDPVDRNDTAGKQYACHIHVVRINDNAIV